MGGLKGILRKSIKTVGQVAGAGSKIITGKGHEIPGDISARREARKLRRRQRRADKHALEQAKLRTAIMKEELRILRAKK